MLLCLISAVLLPAEQVMASEPNLTEPVQEAIAVHTYPHDADAFTEGLVFCKGRVIESTGRYGKSMLKLLNLGSGKVIKSVHLPEELFGEGIALLNGRIYQLTWKAEKALVYNADTLVQEKQSIGYRGEGWGLTTDGRYLIMSNGTDVLTIADPADLRPLRRIRVRSRVKGAVYFLNELEYINNEIWANIWHKDLIVRVDPENGRVNGWVRLDRVVKEKRGPKQVFNGIAYDSKRQRLFISLKLWPWLYEVRLVPAPPMKRSQQRRRSH